MSQLQFTPPRLVDRPTYQPPTLHSTPFVFLRCDAVKKPLQPPYSGPFKVIKRTDKYFVLDINGKHDSVSIDRLKPAYIEVPIPMPSTTSDPPSTSDPADAPANPIPNLPPAEPQGRSPLRATSTRSGRSICLPVRFKEP